MSVLQLFTLLYTVRLSSSSSPCCTLYVCPPAPHPAVHCTSVLQPLTLLYTVRLSSSFSPCCTLYVCPPALHSAVHCTSVLQLFTLLHIWIRLNMMSMAATGIPWELQASTSLTGRLRRSSLKRCPRLALRPCWATVGSSCRDF